MPLTVSSPTSGSPTASPTASGFGGPSAPPATGTEGRPTKPRDATKPATKPVAFGKYRLLQRIARGGMGEVFRASLVGELGFEKPLVIKTILPELASQPRFIDMFAAEAKTAVALNHGNIVPIYELGRSEDTFYIVMGYVDGPSVAELLSTHRRRGHPPPLAVTLAIVRGVLSGLAYAHTEEPGRPAVVHRDITPRNVMVDRSGQVRIVDFGIASPVRAVAAVRAGSTGYVAPEQARAEAVDPRADVFSTGCLLYELLTLDRAFPNEGVWIAPDFARLPEAMRTPLERALALDPALRPADASAFLSALGDAITRHAATFSESDLAAHLRMLFPDGRWSPPPSDSVDDGVTPTTRVRPTTMTFATRLTSVVAAAQGDGEVLTPSGDASGHGTRPTLETSRVTATATSSRRRGLVAALALAAAGLASVWVWASMAPSDGDARHHAARHPAAHDPAGPSEAAPLGPDPLERAGSTSASPLPERAGASETSPPAEPDSSDTSPSLSSSDSADIAPPPALVLHVEPSGATVRIGTQRFAGGSPFTLPLPTHGVLEALVEHPGHTTHKVQLRAGEPGERTVVLRPIVPQGRGSLQVLAPSVSWAEVTVDGRRFGVTPTRKLELTAGSHRVVVRCVPDVCPEPRVLLRRTVEIEPGQTLRLTAG
jgi:eukaryotic-like serine/threonine-protein kinase